MFVVAFVIFSRVLILRDVREDTKLDTPLVCSKPSIGAGVAHLQCHLGKWQM